MLVLALCLVVLSLLCRGIDRVEHAVHCTSDFVTRYRRLTNSRNAFFYRGVYFLRLIARACGDI